MEKKKKTKNKNGIVKCRICGDVMEKCLLAKHRATHAKEVKCNICSTEFRTRKYLLRHIRNLHTEKRHKYKCDECDKTFSYRSHLRRHEMVHTGEKPYECEECGKRFRALYSYDTHMLIHKDEKPFHCSFCPYACRDSSTLRKHVASHTGEGPRYQCTKCERTFKVKNLLKVHIAEDHLGLNVRLTECKTCKKMFKNRSQLTAHVRAVHARAKVAKCEICSRVITNFANMPAHMLTHSDLKPFKCKEDGCDTMFKTKSDARRHSIVHHTRRKTPCSQCGRRFARVGSLRKHELTQHRDRVRDTPCRLCGDRFYNENYLLKHIRHKHTTDKEKYICDHCGFETRNKPSIVMHIKHGHGNENDLKCKICKRQYKRHVYLKMHYLKSHNLRYKSVQRKPARPPLLDTEIKVEALDIEYHDLEGALENAEVVNAEDFMTVSPVRKDDSDDSYTTVELSETLATSIITDNVGALTSIPEGIFDKFFVKHIKDVEKHTKKEQDDRLSLKAKRAQEERERQLVKERERALQEEVERSRRKHGEETGRNTEEDKDGNFYKEGKRKKSAVLYEILTCNVCGKVCQGLRAFNEHVDLHSDIEEEDSDDSEKAGTDSDENVADSEIHRNNVKAMKNNRVFKNSNVTQSEIEEENSKRNKKNYTDRNEMSEESAERNYYLINKVMACSKTNGNNGKGIQKDSAIVTDKSESDRLRSKRKVNRQHPSVEGSQSKEGRNKYKEDRKIKIIKEFYDINVRDLGVEFERFVELCKKVKKNK